MQTATSSKDPRDWKISLSPNPLEQAILLAVVWAFAGGLLYGLSLLEGGLGPLWYVIVLPFPLIVSFYSLRGLTGHNGQLELQPDGFWRTTTNGRKLFLPWDRVEKFYVGVFGDPGVSDSGVPVLGFAFVDGSGERRVEHLSGNLPLSAEKLAGILEFARQEAAKGWPNPPESLKDLISRVAVPGS
ncbi:hypothetical protein GL4_1151 [Methyloceanibacter caenitepidi]|uniref:Uncharacterized protein n=2 Tax=Hyphomicrobiaceae TaxID=45401 RepID=A0A0A8K3N1_9HYPH|nr:hypothetical protein GL4_1151 [Methyloceanibacter caenitepidi]